MTDPCLAAALAYAARGIHAFPLQPRDKKPHPGTRGCLDATTDHDALRQAWERWPGSNVGIATGPSGLLVIDVDGDDGEASLVALQDRHESLPMTLWQTTGRGRQAFLRRPEGSHIRNSAGKLGAGLDVRADGGYVVGPPSIHPSGKRYAWVAAVAIAPAPRWLVTLLEPPPPPERQPVQLKRYAGEISAYAAKALREELDALATAPEGQRNNQLNQAAFALGQLVAGGELSETHVAGALRLVAIGTGLTDHEVEATIRSGMRAGEQQPRASSPAHGTEHG